MAEEIAISLQNVSKCFKRYAHPVDRLKEILLPGKSRAEEFWALQDISLEIPKGQTWGIVGRNGSGKSTLLQIVVGTLKPTIGSVGVNGRISALLELGSGFNPEFTGKQNVFFNGQILGLSAEEIAAKYDEIAAFAEIGNFIEQPVKTYSSGMAIRLAFAVAASVEPDILIVDEALAVGDTKFQARCMKRIRELKEENGVTILFVSHDSSSVKLLCDQAVLMECGKMLEIGHPKDVINHYIALLSLDKDSEQVLNSTGIQTVSDNSKALSKDQIDQEKHRHGNRKATIDSVKILDSNDRETDKLQTGNSFSILIYLDVSQKISDLVIGISIKNLMGLVIYGTNTFLLQSTLLEVSENQNLEVTFKLPCQLNKGTYTLTVGLHSESGLSYDWIDEMVVFEVINGTFCEGLVDLDTELKIRKSLHCQ